MKGKNLFCSKSPYNILRKEQQGLMSMNRTLKTISVLLSAAFILDNKVFRRNLQQLVRGRTSS